MDGVAQVWEMVVLIGVAQIDNQPWQMSGVRPLRLVRQKRGVRPLRLVLLRRLTPQVPRVMVLRCLRPQVHQMAAPMGMSNLHQGVQPAVVAVLRGTLQRMPPLSGGLEVSKLSAPVSVFANSPIL